MERSCARLSAYRNIWWSLANEYEMLYDKTIADWDAYGETFHREDEVLWWAKGGKLYGESIERIAFLKEVLETLEGDWSPSGKNAKNPNLDSNDKAAIKQENCFWGLFDHVPEYVKNGFVYNSPLKLSGDGYYLEYFGRTCPALTRADFSEEMKCQVEIIDIWNMTSKYLRCKSNYIP